MNVREIVSARGVVQAFGRQKVLQGLGLSLAAGHFYALVGPNGTGKSTLLRVLAGDLIPQAGEAAIAGLSLDANEAGRALAAVWVHENLEFQVSASLEKISALHAVICPGWDAALFARVRSHLEMDLGRRYSTLSRGQKVQFQLLLALARKPQLFLLDEVTAVLDLGVREVLLGELKLAVQERQATVLAATNILTELSGYADRLLVLREGGLASDESFEELLKKYGSIEKAAVHLGGRKAG